MALEIPWISRGLKFGSSLFKGLQGSGQCPEVLLDYLALLRYNGKELILVTNNH